jgi:4-hydroxybenzoyl-CoA thioesterase
MPMPPFCHTMPVRFADVDHAGIVYYPKFFDYFHIAMEEFLGEKLGPRGYVDLLDRDRIGFPSVNAQCEFKAPLRFGDIIDVEMSVIRLGTRSVTFGFRVYRRPDGRSQAQPQDAGQAGHELDQGPDERVLAAQGSNTCAFVDLSAFRAIAAPERLKRLLEPLIERSQSI